MDLSMSPEELLLQLEKLREFQKIQKERLLQQQILERQKFVEDYELVYDTLSASKLIADHSNMNSFILENASHDISTANVSNKSEQFYPLSPKIILLENETVISPKSHCLIEADNTVNDINGNTTLEDIPIKTSTTDFNVLLENKLKDENTNPKTVWTGKKSQKDSKAYLKRGDGMTRFGMSKQDIGRKNNKMPWLKQRRKKKVSHTDCEDTSSIEVQSIETHNVNKSKKKLDFESTVNEKSTKKIVPVTKGYESSESEPKIVQKTSTLQPIKTWASVLNEEQQCYLKLLKQSHYYNNYPHTPDESNISDGSVIMSPSFTKISSEKEIAEQNLFDLIEKKVQNDSFCSATSFVAKIMRNPNDESNANGEHIEQNAQLLKLNPNPHENFNSKIKFQHVINHDSNERYSDNKSMFISFDDQNYLEKKSDIQGSKDSSESSDTEETCRLVIDKQVPTSTPNQDYVINFENKQKQKIQKNKVIKIVINREDTDNSTNLHIDGTNDQSHVALTEESTLIENPRINPNFKHNTHLPNDKFDHFSKEEMLKTKLKELEEGLEAINTEHSKINRLKDELKLEKEAFLREKAETESKLNEAKVIDEYLLAEEKEKLQKQKLLYDRHVKEMKSQNCRKDREDLNRLQREIVELKEQMALKETKSGATHARLRNQIKNLEKEKSDLKAECEKLKKENRKINSMNSRTRRLTNIKILADINKSIGKDIDIEDVYPAKHLSSESLTDVGLNKIKQPKKVKPTVIKHSMRSRTRSTPNLTATSKYAKYFSKKDEELRSNLNYESGYGLGSDDDSESSFKSDQNIDIENNTCANSKPIMLDVSPSIQASKCNKSPQTLNKSIEDIYRDKFNKTIEKSLEATSYLGASSQQQLPNASNHQLSNFKLTHSGIESITDKSSKPSTSNLCESNETVRPDGSIEVKYSNGNHKIVSADGSYSKFTYYNGNIKETYYNEGKIKHYYKELNIHHTIYKDKSEVLHFPDGQIERRFPDGSVQTHLPGGAIRWLKPGSNEEWRFPDGTLISVNSIGEKTLRFRNGQIEVHTAEFRKREFPDGTVKIIYADGIAETRYANGRIRIKDKHGNLIMDSINRTYD